MSVAGCNARKPASPTAPEPIAIIASERGPHGVRLVAIDERGDRRFELVAQTSTARDSQPAVSPDGRWVVFASTRDRALDTTSLWIAPLGVETTPVRLTDGTGGAIDAHPAWDPDGRSIVFASTRVGGEFDLWRLAVDPAGKPGALTQLTTAAGHEVTPSVTPDGTIIYAAVIATGVTSTGTREIDSHLEELAPDGTIRRLTAGPGDTSPAVSPDGKTIAFARPAPHNGQLDSELWRVTRGKDDATRIVDLPLTDESGPVWSPDGRYLFATSVLRGASGNVVFSSVVHIDLRETPTHARLLGDHAGPVARLTPAIRARQLDAAALRSDPEYLPELARIMAAEIAKQMQPQR